MTDHALVARRIAASPYAMSREEAQEHIARRRRELLRSPPDHSAKPEPDFAPVAMPIIEDPAAFARDFLKRRSEQPSGPSKPTPKSKKPRGRKPTSDRPGADRFRVIDGDGVDKPKDE